MQESLLAAMKSLADAAITRCECLCCQALIASGPKTQERLRTYTSQCAHTIAAPWESKVVPELVELVQNALQTPGAASSAGGGAAAGPGKAETTEKKEKKHKGSKDAGAGQKKEKKEKKEKKAKAENGEKK